MSSEQSIPPAPAGLQYDVDLQPLNTLGVSARAAFYVEVTSVEQLQQAVAWAASRSLALCPLGEGSNVVFAGDYAGLVLLIRIAGRELTESDNSGRMLVTAGAGENWHQLVLWTIAQGAYGLENLSLIPGCVGAAPIQNIGAYGVEINNVFHSLQALNLDTGQLETLTAEQCGFGYRDSLFKREGRDRFIITSVNFALSNTFTPVLGYGHLQKEVLEAADGEEPTAKLVSDTVCKIREAKLPNPKVLGNAGSFFKNPVIDSQHHQRLLEQEPDLVAFPAAGECWKLAAGWLVDRCGFKGLREETDAGVYQQQALVLVNHGTACGRDILGLASRIQDAVRSRFQVSLEIEPRIYSE